MSHRTEHTLAFSPEALNDLTRAFEAAWLELRIQGIDLNTEEQLERIRAKLAQRIAEDAAEGEHDVERLKEYGLQGLPHLCAHGVRVPKRSLGRKITATAHRHTMRAAPISSDPGLPARPTTKPTRRRSDPPHC
jgi:hypothetical protein